MRIGSGIASPSAWVGKPLPFQRSNVKASDSRTPGPKSSRSTSMSATSQPDVKLWTAHSWAVSWSIRTISSRSSVGAAGRREGEDVAHHLGGVARRRGRASGRGSRSRRRTGSRPRGRGRCSRCSGAARPSRRSSRTSSSKPGGLADPASRAGTSAAATRAAARTRCPARAPAWRRIREAERWSKMGCPPDVSAADGRAQILPRRALLSSLRGNGQRSCSKEDIMATIASTDADPIKVGVIADQTGPLSFVGLANANVARMVVGDINAKGGLLGRAARAAPRGRRDRRRGRRREGGEAGRARPGRRHLRRHLQLHAAGDQGPGRRRGQDALHLPRAVRGAGVRPADLLHRPRARAAGRPVHPVADAGDRREDVLPAVGRLHLAARDERARPRGRRPRTAGRSSARSTSRSTTWTTRRRSSGSSRAARTWCSTRSCPPGSRRSSSSCTTPASRAAAGTSSARTSTRTS